MKLKAKRLLSNLNIATLALASVVFFAPTASAAPFVCGDGFYQVINGTLTELNPETGQYYEIGLTGSLSTNSAGYNSEDNYIYAWQAVDPFGSGSNGLVRIEDDATTTFVGLPAGMPTSGGLVAGDFDLSGNLYIHDHNQSVLWRVDVSGVAASQVSLSAPLEGVNDLVFVEGKLYGLTGTVLYEVDPSSGSVEAKSIEIEPDASTPNQIYGAGWGADNERLFFSRNSDGKIFEISGFAGASPEAAVVLDGQTSTGNDGASCVLGSSPLDPLDAVNDENTTMIGKPVSASVLPNDSGKGIVVTDYTQPENGSIVINPDGTYTYTPNAGFTGVDSLTYTITDEFGQTDTATLTITVAPGAPATGLRRVVGLIAVVIMMASLIAAGVAFARRAKVKEK